MSYRAPGRSGPPVWLITMTAVMLVFGGYFLWTGVRNYLAAGVQGVIQATETAALTAGALASPTPDLRFTPAPTRTPVPPCQEFVVTVPEAIIRACPSTHCAIEGVRHEGDRVCVLEREYTNAEWYIVDLDDSPFFTDLAYMHESIIRAANPTLTPSMTMTALPTLTPLPSSTPLPTPPPTETSNPATPPTVTPTFTPSPTPPLISG
jgi:hypothetical protein